jgi:hypothetical protein
MADPTVTGPRYDARADDWALIDALLSGRKALLNEDFLPKHEAEMTANYEARQKRSFLWPAFENTIRELTSTTFDRSMTASDEGLDPDYERFLTDVNGEGEDVNRFARHFFAGSLANGVEYILVDAPKLEEGATLADQRAAGVTWTRVPASALLEWQTAKIGGKTRFVYARIRETYEERDGFEVVTKTQIREIEAGEWRVWRQDNGWAVVDQGTYVVGGKPLEWVPLVAFICGELESNGNAKPPLLTLAEKNLEHFQKSSDLGNIIRVTCFPMLGLSGPIQRETDENGNPKDIAIGPMRLLQTSDASGKWYFVEATGGSVSKAEDQILRLEREMQRLSYAPLVHNTDAITATVASINSSRGHSVLEAMSLAMKDALDLALQYTGMWLGKDMEKAPTLTINTDFAAMIGKDAELTAIQGARNARDISRKTYWFEMRRRGVLSANFDPDAEEKELGSEEQDSFGFDTNADVSRETSDSQTGNPGGNESESGGTPE